MLTYDVEGMTCGGCVKSVTRAIQAVSPGSMVKVDLATKKVAVDGATNSAGIEAAIRAAGFEVRAAA